MSAETKQQQYENVIETWQIYDTVRIGTHINNSLQGFQSLSAMADAEDVPFLNVRNSSEAGLTYTNIASKDKVPWAFWLESIGMRFVYPDPNLNASSEHSAVRAASKIFAQYLPEHAYFQFSIREDIIITVKPHMMPAGFGPTGVVNGDQTAFQSVMTSGQPWMKNRWIFTGKPIPIPRDTPIKGVLKFSDFGKKMLREMGEVAALDFTNSFSNEAFIELTLRGKRGVQQRGEYHYE